VLALGLLLFGERQMECEEIIDQAEAARILGVRPKVLEGWRARKINLPVLRYTRRTVRYRRSDVLALMRSALEEVAADRVNTI
jgi:hypothetical protein